MHTRTSMSPRASGPPLSVEIRKLCYERTQVGVFCGGGGGGGGGWELQRLSPKLPYS